MSCYQGQVLCSTDDMRSCLLVFRRVCLGLVCATRINDGEDEFFVGCFLVMFMFGVYPGGVYLSGGVYIGKSIFDFVNLIK